jgi:hypothetical protein
MSPGRARLGAVAVALALLAGCAQAGANRAEPPPAAATTRPPPAADGVDAARDFRSTRGYKATPVPVRLEIARIGVSAGMQRLGRAADGTVEVPEGPHKWDTAGWYAGGTRPGDPGSAVILGRR